MANRTDPDASTIHGTNPQYLIEKIIRAKIQDSRYWKEHCFGLSAEGIVERAMELDHIGGLFGGNQQPTPFLCLLLKMLQIQPEKDIVVEFIKNSEYKYVRALGALYFRMVAPGAEVYHYLEPLLNDYRKIRRVIGNAPASKANRDHAFPEKMGWAGCELTYMDQFVDDLFHEIEVCNAVLPQIPKRVHLEDQGELPGPRESELDKELEEMEKRAIADTENTIKADANDELGSKQVKSDYDMAAANIRLAKKRERDREDEKSRKLGSEAPEKRKKSSLADEDEERQREIDEANALRAKLGLKPLRE